MVDNKVDFLLLFNCLECLPCCRKLHQKVHQSLKEYQLLDQLDENSLSCLMIMLLAIQLVLVNQAKRTKMMNWRGRASLKWDLVLFVSCIEQGS